MLSPDAIEPASMEARLADHREDLLANWSLAVNGQKPFPIKGLDQ